MFMKNSLIIAIDGPAASGKSTTAKLLAKLFDYTYIDTGAMYRAVALAALEKEVDYQSEQEIADLLESLEIEFRKIGENQHIFLNGVDVSARIREAEITKLSSDISQNKLVREKLVSMQQKMGESGGIIMDGRDIGTVVFPDADVKIFLTASVRTRAERRWKELKHKGVSLEAIEKELIWRDNNDSTRQLAPLKKAEDAIEVDTSEMSIEQQVNHIYQLISDKK
jgi:CMP/dCMP kinase